MTTINRVLRRLSEIKTTVGYTGNDNQRVATVDTPPLAVRNAVKDSVDSLLSLLNAEVPDRFLLAAAQELGLVTLRATELSDSEKVEVKKKITKLLELL